MVRAAVASHPRLNENLARLLLGNPEAGVRAALGGNPCVDRSILTILLNDPAEICRAGVVGNPGLPVAECFNLLTNPSEKIRSGLATNPHLPPELFGRLAADPSPAVQRALATNPSLPVELLTTLLLTEDLSVWENLARNPQAPLEMLAWMAQKQHESLYKAIAQNKNASADLLRQLATGEGTRTQDFWYALASHPQTPIDVLQVVISLPHLESDLFLRVIDHSALASDRQQILFDHFIHALQGEIQRGTSRFKLLLVTHPSVAIEVLEVFSHSTRWEERYLVARHPKTPSALLKRLQADTSSRVRVAANRQLQTQPATGDDAFAF